MATATALITGTSIAVATAAVTIPAAYLGVLSLAGLPRHRRVTNAETGDVTRFVVLVPAHNEATGIGATLSSLRALRYPADRYDVHVVADNCTDATADVVRASGWTAHERSDLADPGKGPALNWLLDRLVTDAVQFDVVIVVDADTVVDAEFLWAMHAAFSDGARAAQGYYSVRDPDSSPVAAFRFAALACRHHLRSLGRDRMGGSSGLHGNGMAFASDVLTTHRWSGHLVEDAELQNELLLDGCRVRYVPDAVLWAEMPATTAAATTQNERWERGRLEIARRYVPALLRQAAMGRERRLAHVDAVLDHLVPPLSVLVAAEVGVTAAAAVGAVAGHRPSRWAVMVNVAALVVTIGHVVAGLVSVRAPRRMYVSLIRAPRLLLWKVALWGRVARRGGSSVTWERTRRNAEVNA